VAAAPSSVRPFEKGDTDGSEEKGEEEVEEEGLRPSRIQGRDAKQRALKPTSRMRWTDPVQRIFLWRVTTYRE
jgi:hypothetical protein